MTEENSMSNWFQDNLRIIISVGIVILLVFAIYSYSKRNSRTDIVVDDSQIEEIAMTAGESGSDEINEIIDEIKDEEITEEPAITIETDGKAEEVTVTIEKDSESDTNEDSKAVAKIALQKKIEEAANKAKVAQADADKQQEAKELAEAEQKAKETAQQEAKIALEQKLKEETAAIKENTAKKEEEENSEEAKNVMKEVIESRSRQTEGVIVVVAVPRDSKTTLARKASAEYIATNNVSGLTPAHKIYIEDYVRKATQSNGIHPGTEMGFANDLISSAIASSRTLSSAQLQNLDKYVANVSSL